jgi:hypothetical protein
MALNLRVNPGHQEAQLRGPLRILGGVRVVNPSGFRNGWHFDAVPALKSEFGFVRLKDYFKS